MKYFEEEGDEHYLILQGGQTVLDKKKFETFQTIRIEKKRKIMQNWENRERRTTTRKYKDVEARATWARA